MSASLAARIGMWVQGLLGAAIGGGAAAVVSGLVVPALDPSGDFKAMSGTWFEMMGLMFLANGAIGAMLYLKQHPVPEIVEPDEPPKG